MAKRTRWRFPENLLRRLEVQPNGCVNFTGSLTTDGYGQVQVGDRRPRLAHRAMWELMIGSILDGLELDHLCRNRACVNVGHLEPVTHQENGLRGVGPPAINARKAHCIRDHEFTPENTYRTPTGRRQCRECRRMRDAR